MDTDELFASRLTAGQRIGVWIVTIILGLLFLVAGLTKLAATDVNIANFERWGYPLWFMYVVGVVETTAAILLLIPRTAFYGGLVLFGNMTGAMVTHIGSAEWNMVPVVILLGTLAATVALARRPAYVDERLHIAHPAH